MMLPEGHRLTNPLFFRESLAARGPVNTNAPGLINNKNGPPGPEGNQKGPPVAAISTEELASPASQPLPETTFTSSDSPLPPPPAASSTASSATSPALSTALTSTSSPGLMPSFVIITSTVPTPPATSSSTSSPGLTPPSVIATSIVLTLSTVPTPPATESLTKAYLSTSSDRFSTSTKHLVSESPSSTLSVTFDPVETTLWTTFTYTSSAIATQTGIVYFAPNATSQFEYTTTSLGKKSGIAVGAISGFAFILILIFLLFKRHRAEFLKALPQPIRRLLGLWGSSCWLSHRQTSDTMFDSLLTVEVNSSGSPTLARPTMTESARWSFRKSLTRLLRFNPLGLNPVTSQGVGARTPSRKSFASSFHRLSAASNRHSAFCPSFLQGQPESVIDPESLPIPCASFRSPQPSVLPGRSREFAKSETDNSPRPRIMPPQVPPHTLQRPWHHRNSQMTMASEKSETRSFKSVPGWVKFHYPYGSNSGEGAPREPGKALPPLRISPGSWLKTKALHRSHSTTTSEDEMRLHRASDNGDKSEGTKQAVFG